MVCTSVRNCWQVTNWTTLEQDKRPGSHVSRHPSVWAKYQRDQQVCKLAVVGTQKSKAATGETMRSVSLWGWTEWCPCMRQIEIPGSRAGYWRASVFEISYQRNMQCLRKRVCGPAAGEGLLVSRRLQLRRARTEGELLDRLSEATQGICIVCIDIYVYIYVGMYAYFPLTRFYPAQPERKTRGGCWCCLFVCASAQCFCLQ